MRVLSYIVPPKRGSSLGLPSPSSRGAQQQWRLCFWEVKHWQEGRTLGTSQGRSELIDVIGLAYLSFRRPERTMQ